MLNKLVKWNQRHWWTGLLLGVFIIISAFTGWLDQFGRLAIFFVGLDVTMTRLANALGLQSKLVEISDENEARWE